MNSCDFEYKERFLFCNWLFLQIKLIKLTRIHAFSSARISSFKLIGNSEYKNILTQIRFFGDLQKLHTNVSKLRWF